MKRNRVARIMLIALVSVLTAALVGAWVMFGTQFKAAQSVQKLDEGLWSMEYAGDYGFDEFLAQGGAASDEEMAVYISSFLSHGFWKPDAVSVGGKFGCSTLSAQSPEGHSLFGRNFDWANCDSMLVHTIPANGYASFSTVCLDFLGFGEEWIPGGSMKDKYMALAAVYVPLDGMNEKGLCVADLIVNDGQVTGQDTERPDITTTSALRLLLDKAATVDEALSLLEEYDIHFSIGIAHHFSIADATGRSVVVEYVDGEMEVTETPIVTNHYLADGELPYGHEQSHTRYDTLTSLLRKNDGAMTADAVCSALEMVAQSNFPESNGGDMTQWSLIYDQQELTAMFYVTEDWDHPYLLKIGKSPWCQKVFAR